MSAIFIQVKNRVDVLTLFTTSLDSKQNFYPDLNTTRPSIVLDMHLGIDQRKFIVRTSKTEQLHIFSIIVQGLDHLLKAGDLLNDHPRQDNGALAAVKRLKPLWSAGDNFYDWFEKPAKKRKQESGSSVTFRM